MKQPSRTLRLILDGPRPAALNMAVDEVLMEAQTARGQTPVLRIYFWDRPSYSIGYFQNIRRAVIRHGCGPEGIPVVRRLTGGGTVLHGEDVTFSLSLKNPNPWVPSETKASYLKINEALWDGLRRTEPGIDFADCKTAAPLGRGGDRICFEAPSCYDLLLGGRKIVGASQRRKDGLILHQSSVFLSGPKEATVSGIIEGFRSKWGVEFEESELSPGELEAAEKKSRERYSSEEWAYAPMLSDAVR